MQHHTSSNQLRWGMSFSLCSPTSTAATAAAAHHTIHCRHSPANVCVWGASVDAPKDVTTLQQTPFKIAAVSRLLPSGPRKGFNLGLHTSRWERPVASSVASTPSKQLQVPGPLPPPPPPSHQHQDTTAVCVAHDCNRALLPVHVSNATSRATSGSARQTKCISCTGEREIWSKPQLTTHTTPHASGGKRP